MTKMKARRLNNLLGFPQSSVSDVGLELSDSWPPLLTLGPAREISLDFNVPSFHISCRTSAAFTHISFRCNEMFYDAAAQKLTYKPAAFM